MSESMPDIVTFKLSLMSLELSAATGTGAGAAGTGTSAGTAAMSPTAAITGGRGWRRRVGYVGNAAGE